jgi:DnaJ-class molecular chaperone
VQLHAKDISDEGHVPLLTEESPRCRVCNGSGQVQVGRMGEDMGIYEDCPICHGDG